MRVTLGQAPRRSRKPLGTPAGGPDRCEVIADDLTGALDVVSPFARPEAPLPVSFAPAGGERPAGALLSAVSTRSRHCTPEEAGSRVGEAARRALRSGATLLYKKTDSLLRGNIAAELSGLLEATGGKHPLVYAPSYPEAGRVVRAGRLETPQDPAALLSAGTDPRAPVRETFIPSLLSGLPGGAQCHPPPRNPRSREWHPALGPGCHVVDGETPSDLGRLAGALATSSSRPLLMAGPAGLSRHLFPLLGLCGSPGNRPAPKGPALVVQGSITPRSLSQVSRARSLGMECLEASPSLLWGVATGPAPDPSFWLRVGRACAESRSLLLHTPPPLPLRSGPDPFTPWCRTTADFSREAPVLLGLLAKRILELTGYKTLVLAGGETAESVMDALGVSHGSAEGEMVPGVNLLRILALGSSLAVVVKSGGMGPENLYEHFLP